jgi:MFS transporter, PPP family, 3-phenylpropionic acid transporter
MSAQSRSKIRAYLFAYFAYGGLTPFFALYAESLAYTAAQIGLMNAMMQVVRTVTPPIWGHLADTTGHRERWLMGTAIAAACTCGAFIFVTDFTWFFAVLLISQVFISAQTPLGEAAAVDALNGDITRYGRLRMWGSFGFIVAALATGPFFEALSIGWWPVLCMLSLFAVAATAQRLPATTAMPQIVPTAKVAELFKRADVLWFFTSAFFMVGAHMALYAFYSLYLQQQGYSKTWIGALWALGVAFEVVAFHQQKHWLSRAPLHVWLMGSIVVCALRFALIAAFAQSLTVLILAQALHAITFAVHHAASLGMMQKWFTGPTQSRGQALYFSLTYGLGGAVGALMAGELWQHVSPASTFWVSSLWALAALAAAWLCLRAQRGMEGKGQAITAPQVA